MFLGFSSRPHYRRLWLSLTSQCSEMAEIRHIWRHARIQICKLKSAKYRLLAAKQKYRFTNSYRADNSSQLWFQQDSANDFFRIQIRFFIVCVCVIFIIVEYQVLHIEIEYVSRFLFQNCPQIRESQYPTANKKTRKILQTKYQSHHAWAGTQLSLRSLKISNYLLTNTAKQQLIWFNYKEKNRMFCFVFCFFCAHRESERKQKQFKPELLRKLHVVGVFDFYAMMWIRFIHSFCSTFAAILFASVYLIFVAAVAVVSSPRSFNFTLLQVYVL